MKGIIDKILFLVFIVLLLEYIEHGRLYIFAFMAFILVYSIYRVWTHRDIVIALMKNIESILYGKPLDKELWEKGEFKEYKKNRKLKFVWKKDG